MVRWEPDSSGRLGRAALDLYSERGYEQTTVHDIAERAGVTERTFFRYFADKREVLFDGSHALEETVVNAVIAAPAEDSDHPVRLAVEALQAAAPFFDDRYDYARQRSAVIAANPSLQERELLKLSSMTVGIASALRARGVAETEAYLAADVAVVVFHRGFQRWLGGEGRSLGPFMRDVYEELAALIE